MEQDRSFTIDEHNRIPGLSLFLGFGAMLPIAAGTILAYLLPGPSQEVLRDLTLLWSGAILLFLSGVRRGLAFRTPPAGETPGSGGAPDTPVCGTASWSGVTCGLMPAHGPSSTSGRPIAVLAT